MTNEQRADAARYRWLRDGNNSTHALWHELNRLENEAFDAEIDRAMKEAK